MDRYDFINGDMSYESFKDMSMDMMVPRLDMLSMFMEEKLDHDNGVAPDTTGADYFFIQSFVNEEMIWDFDRIEEYFMQHCYDKLREFTEVKWYDRMEAKYLNPDRSHKLMVTSLMLNGAKAGDEYCIGLIKYLFKTYHKPMYKQLKRFSKISLNEIINLAKDTGDYEVGYAAIILTMCSIDNIEMSSNVSILYRILNKSLQDVEACEDDDIGYFEFEEGLFDECHEQIMEWTEEEEKKHSNYKKRNRAYWDDELFVATCLRHMGYPEDYIERSMENYMGLELQFARTYAVLKSAYPKREFTYEEIQKYTHIYDAIAAVVDISDNLDEVNKEFLGLEMEYDSWDEDTLFNPDNIVVPSKPKKQEEKKILTNVAAVNIENTSKEDYLAEIDELRKKLNQKEMEYKHLKSQYVAARSAKNEAEKLLTKYEGDRDELIALREFAYKLEQEIPNIQEVSVDDMRNIIAEKAYVIIGGHVQWVNKLKNEFPNWTFITPSAYRTVDAGLLDNKDMVFFFTDYISHVVYGKFVAVTRERKIPFSYLHGVNMEQIIRQIYESGKKI